MLENAIASVTYSRLLEKPLDSVWKRFREKIVLNSVRGCWEWQAAKSHGYGQFYLNGGPVAAHVLMMKWMHGGVSPELVVDHFVCDNRCCVNPDHLKIVTRGANVLRSDSAPGLQSRKTECKNGHPLSGDNLKMDGKGRRCKICREDYNREYFKKRPRKDGKRAPVKLSDAHQMLLNEPSYISVYKSMLSAPDIKVWLRFISHINIDELSGCWVFGSSTIDGYGQFRWKQNSKPHRIMRIWVDGEIPLGFDVHHQCYRRNCVNPAHLQSISPRENILDSENTRAGRNKRKTHCPVGHELEGENLMRVAGRRVCRTCHNKRGQDYPVEKKREYALKFFHKKMADPEFREKKRLQAAEYRKKYPERVAATQARRRLKKLTGSEAQNESE